jgi:hypothetical protein
MHKVSPHDAPHITPHDAPHNKHFKKDLKKIPMLGFEPESPDSQVRG